MKLVTPAERKTAQPQPQARPRPNIPVSTWRYISLACGHFTTSDVAALYLVFRTMPDTYFCERCQEWTQPQKLEPLPTQPQEPPF